MKLTILNSDLNIGIETTKDVTILDAALDAGIRLPFGCKSGECGICKCELVSSSQIQEDIYDPLALSEKERSRGRILACVSRLTEDAIIRVQHQDLFDIETLSAQVTKIEKRNSNVIILHILLDNNQIITYKPGQYIRLNFMNGVSRAYSIASTNEKNELIFHIRYLNNGQASSFIYNQLSIGDKISIAGPFGNSYLRAEHDGPIIAICVGTGWAPIKSIIESSLSQNPSRIIKLLLKTRNFEEFYDKNDIKELSQNYRNFLCSIITESYGSFQQRVLKKQVISNVNAYLQKIGNIKVYIAGSYDLVENVKNALVTTNMNMDNFHSDVFFQLPYTYKSKAA